MRILVRLWPWIKFYWYKYVKDDIPTIVVSEPWTDKPSLLTIDDELIVARMNSKDE